MNTSPIPAGYRAATAHDLAFLPRGSMWWCHKRKSWERSLKATATQGRIYCVPVGLDSQESASMPVAAQNTPQNPSEAVPSITTAESARERLKNALKAMEDADNELKAALDEFLAIADKEESR
jgi:hypothetical protein